MPRKRTWTDEQLATAVANSLSYAQVIRSLNLAIAGGSYSWIKRHIQRLNLDTSHFRGQAGWGRYGVSADCTWEDILVANSSYQSSEIRRIVLKEGLKENRCEGCGITEWRERPLTIQLHHKNKIRNDHRLENLEMLCPNCHSQE
jgi:transposase-like protein